MLTFLIFVLLFLISREIKKCKDEIIETICNIAELNESEEK